MVKPNECVGIIDTNGLSPALEAADTMLKSGKVKLIGIHLLGSCHVAVTICGAHGPIQTAIEAGAVSAGRKGKVLGRNVIPRMNKELFKYLNRLTSTPSSILSRLPKMK